MTTHRENAGTVQPERQSLTIGQATRAVLAILVLATLVIGMPVILWGLGQSLSPVARVDLPRLGSALAGPDDGSLFLLAVLLIGWIAWAVFCLSVVVEVVALVRGLPSPHLPLLRIPQQGAALLVATAALLVTPAGTTPSLPVARPVASVAVLNAADRSQPDAGVSRGNQPLVQAAAVAASQTLRKYPTVTVHRHDTLWALSETYLGSGERFREIVELNLGRTQPDGRTLTDANWIYPGWVLRLPDDARVSSEPSHGAEADQPNNAYVVERGDSLWEIAEQELGQGERYTEIYDLNENGEQPDGLRLTDVDEIRPGWRLRLPTKHSASQSEKAAEAADADAEKTETSNAPREPRLPSLPPETFRAAAAETPTASPTSSSSATGSSTEATERGDTVAPTFVLGLGAMALTGLVAELARRRRLQQRLRKVGQRIDMPASDPDAAERKARASADPVTVETLKVALRMLAMSCRATGRPLPDIAVIRVTTSAIELDLLTEEVSALVPFEARDARTWCVKALPSASIDDDLIDPYPGLVTLGVQDDALVLLNLEAFGSVMLAGPTTETESVLRALSMELALGVLSDGATLSYVGCFPQLATVVATDRARFLEDSSSAVREADVRSATLRRALESSGAVDMREARPCGMASDVGALEVLIASDELSSAPAPWSGVAVLMTTQSGLEHDTCTIRVRSDGTARLDPLGIEVMPQTLSQSDYDHLVSLLRTALPPQEELEPEGESEGEQRVGCDLWEERAAALDALPDPYVDPTSTVTGDRNPPRLLLLGKVHVEGADDAAAPGRRRRATELVAFLALHPGATTHQIDEAMWPGRRVAKNTRNPFVSRVRQWLGRAPDGEPFLPLVADGGEYRLRPEVSCDWHEFLRLARRGLSEGPDGVHILALALGLVRGRPCLGIDPATYTWAEADIQEMISAIVDVAHVLSATRCDAGDYRGAQEAAAIGLLVDSCSEVLYRDAIRAAAARGDRTEAERLSERLREEVALLDPDDGVASETAELLSAVKGSYARPQFSKSQG